jgi:hypothetical protein
MAREDCPSTKHQGGWKKRRKKRRRKKTPVKGVSISGQDETKNPQSKIQTMQAFLPSASKKE